LNIRCLGLIAEEVEKVNPDVVVHDKKGQPLTVRYDQVNAMLLNEFRKEHRKVHKLEAALETVNERLKKQEADLREVRAMGGIRRAGSRLASQH
jgi:TfoX/Sxy family transcriptional regulator of competence genes